METAIDNFKTAKMNNASHVPIHSSVNLENSFLTTGRFLFELNHPAGNDLVVLKDSYDDKEIVINIAQLRGLVSLLHDEFTELGIQKGTSIMLVSFPASSDLLKSIYFISLVTMGARVFMPHESGREELHDWISNHRIQYALIPGKELLSHEHHENDNAVLLEMNDIFISRHVALLDTISSFPLDKIISSGEYLSMEGSGGKSQVYQHVLPEDESLTLTFHNSYENGNLKTYTQHDIILHATTLKLPISVLTHPMAGGGSSHHKSSPSRL